MEDLAKHCNVAKFAYRFSTIEDYNKHTFDYKHHYQFLTRQTSVTAAAASARKEAAAKRHAVSSKPTFPSNLFSSSSVTFPPPPLSPSAISFSVSHFDHMIKRFHLPPPLSPIPEIQMNTINNADTLSHQAPHRQISRFQTFHTHCRLHLLFLITRCHYRQTLQTNFPSMPTLAQILQYSDITPADAHTDAHTDTDT